MKYNTVIKKILKIYISVKNIIPNLLLKTCCFRLPKIDLHCHAWGGTPIISAEGLGVPLLDAAPRWGCLRPGFVIYSGVETFFALLDSN